MGTAAGRRPALEGAAGGSLVPITAGRRSTSLEASTTGGGGGCGDKRSAKGRRLFSKNGANGGDAAAAAAAGGLRGGRKSVSDVEAGGSRLQLDCVAAFLGVKVVAADMPAMMQVQAFRCARRVMDAAEEKKVSTRQMAHDIKKVGVRQGPRPAVALHLRVEFRVVRDALGGAVPLLLHRQDDGDAVQDQRSTGGSIFVLI